MQHVVTRPNAPFRTSNGALEIHQIPSWQDNLIWLLVSPDSGEAAAVDGPEADSVLEYCKTNGLRLTTIFNTHTHSDHVGINRALQKRDQLESIRVVGPARAAAAVPGITEPVDEGDTVTFSGASARVLLTEGHINGHISFVFDDVLFCGDTLFGGGCGYLFDGPPEKMYASLHRLKALDGATRVCCAHEYTQDNLRFAWSVEPENGALAERIRGVWSVRARGGCTVPSTIAEECATNPFMRWASEPLRQHVADQMPGVPMDSDADVFAATRALKDTKAYRQLGDESLPLGA